MKKFEEEIKGKVETVVTQPGCSMTREAWYKAEDIHELSKGWISPEDHQAEIEKLKSQLEKQQPEIPEFVAEYIKKHKAIGTRYIATLLDVEVAPNNLVSWLTDIGNEKLFIQAWYGSSYTVAKDKSEIPGCQECSSTVIQGGCCISCGQKVKLDGNTVEKPKTIVSPCPVCRFEDVKANFCGVCGHKNEYVEAVEEKRFYLKNKLTGLNLVEEKTFSLTGKHIGERFREFEMQYIPTEEQEARLYKNTFTQQEIYSMETGSYEPIPVEDK